jgi:prophage regulatory protein
MRTRRYLRLKQIIPEMVPVSRSTWWAGVSDGRFPQPVKLGPKTTCWKIEDIDRLMEHGIERPDQGEAAR